MKCKLPEYKVQVQYTMGRADRKSRVSLYRSRTLCLQSPAKGRVPGWALYTVLVACTQIIYITLRPPDYVLRTRIIFKLPSVASYKHVSNGVLQRKPVCVTNETLLFSLVIAKYEYQSVYLTIGLLVVGQRHLSSLQLDVITETAQNVTR